MSLRRIALAVARLAVALAACSACSEYAPSSPALELSIYGGEPTGECRWSNVVSLGQRCSGVLVHPELVLYAAHCGVDIQEVRYDGGTRSVAECAAFPGAQPGGTDLAFCRLREPLEDVTPAVILESCEALQLRSGAQAHLVGFGDSEEADFGVRREALGRLSSVDGVEYEVESVDTGTCSGDSGSPLFVSLETATGRALRVAGVLSAKDSGGCLGGNIYYTKVRPLVPWLQAATALDLGPCTDDNDDWKPTPACVNGSIASCDVEASVPSSTCGPAWERNGVAAEAYEVELTSPEAGAVISADARGRGYVRFDVSPAEAEDVRLLELEVVDASGVERLRRAVTLQPWRLGEAWLPAGEYEARLRVESHEGKRREVSRAFTIESAHVSARGSGCAVAQRPDRALGAAGWLGLSVAGVVGALRLCGARKRRRRARPA